MSTFTLRVGAAWLIALVSIIPNVGGVVAAENNTGVAVIIGNSSYQGGLPEVTYALNDANAFRDYLIDVLGYDPDNIINLRNASQADLTKTFGNPDNHRGHLWRLVDVGLSDVVVFYSGHGVPGADSQAYLLPVDADPDVPEINGFALDLLYANLAKLGARSVVVYLDACFSGQSWGGRLSDTSGVGISAANRSPGEGFAVLTAAAASQVAVWDDEAKHGVFTKHLLDALNGAADAGDNVVTLVEVKEYLDEHMTKAAKRKGRNQNASAFGNMDMVLAAFGPSGAPRDRPPEQFIVLAPVSLRESPSVNATEVAFLNSGAAVVRVGEIDNWLEVETTEGQNGFVIKTFLTLLETQPDALPPGSEEIPPTVARTMYTVQFLNVRSEPSTAADLVAEVGRGVAVQVTGLAQQWYHILLADGRTGFVPQTLLTSAAPGN